MPFIPFYKFILPTDKTRQDIFRILHANIASDTSYQARHYHSHSHMRKPFIGRIEKNSVRFSSITRQAHGSTLVFSATVLEEDQTITLTFIITWHLMDYLINGAILLFFAAMATLSILHMIRIGQIRFVDMLPISLFVFAYAMLMAVFTTAAKHRQRVLTHLFTELSNQKSDDTNSVFG